MSRRRIVALALAGALLVAGCQDEPEPRFEDPTESPTPSASESSGLPEKQSAEEFVREWVRLQTQMQNSGDTADFRAISKGCKPCAAFATRIEAVYEHGGFIDTNGWRLDKTTCSGPDAKQSCESRIQSSPTKFRESASAEVQNLPGGSITVVFVARHTRSGWNMTDTYEIAS